MSEWHDWKERLIVAAALVVFLIGMFIGFNMAEAKPLTPPFWDPPAPICTE